MTAVAERSLGRAPNELRPLGLELGYTRYAEGSVLARQGETWVLCNASVEDRVPPHCVELGRGWVTAEYAMLPRATHERTGRDSRKGPPGGRTLEIQRLIGRSLRAVVDLSKLAGFTIRLDCDVLQADGGTRTTAISGAYVAMAMAIDRLRAEDLLKADPIENALAAISVGLVGGQMLVDLDYSEDSHAQVDLNLVMDDRARVIEVQATAESAPFSRTDLDLMIDVGSAAIRKVRGCQDAALATWRDSQRR